MKMYPIIAIVDEPTFQALNDHADDATTPSAAMQRTMLENGWTIFAMCNGAILKAAMEQGVERYPSVTDDVPRWTQEEIDRAKELAKELRKVIRVLPPTDGYPSVTDQP